MQIFRTVLWVLTAVVVSAFVAMNWRLASVNLWPLEGGYLHVDWPIGLIAAAAFLLGVIPMWLLAKAARWRLNRRIATLENMVKATTPTPMIATSTQFDAAEFQPKRDQD